MIQLDIKLRKFTEEELGAEVWKVRKFDGILLWLCDTVSKQKSKEKWTKCCTFPSLKKANLGITKNYSGITLNSVAAEVYNLLLNIRPIIE